MLLAPTSADAVPFVATPFEVVQAMLEVARVGPSDTVMDLGSGDGRIVIVAADKYGARGVGIERNAELVRTSMENARRAGVEDKVEFRQQDLFETDLRGVSVLTMYLLPTVNLALRLKILEQLAPGARVVSHEFDMGDWPPDEHLVVGGADVYMWVVPANAAGVWRMTIPGDGDAGDATAEIEIRQRFQKVTALNRGKEPPFTIDDAELVGNELSLDVVDRKTGERRRFTGRVGASAIQGSFADGREAHLDRLRVGKISTDRAEASTERAAR